MAVTLFNNVAYSFAAITLISTLTQDTKCRYVAVFVLLTAIGILLTYAPNLIMPTNILVLTLCFTRNPKGLRQAFYASLTTIFLLWGYIVLATSVALLVAPYWHNSNGFNILMGSTLAIASLTAKFSRNFIYWCKVWGHNGYAVALAIVILTFFSLVLPYLYAVVETDNARHWAVILLSLMVVIAIVTLIIHRLINTEYQRRNIASQMERQKSYASQVQAQYDRIVTLKHYYTKLYESLAPYIRNKDMKGLRNFFETTITPIHRGQVLCNSQLSNISSELLRNFFEVTAEQVSAMENVTFEMDISGHITFQGSMELDVFEILCNLTDNAIKALSTQANGLLRLNLYQEDKTLVIQVANTIIDHLDIEQIYKKPKRGQSHGYGLIRVREIVYKHSCMGHLTYKHGAFDGNEIFIQQITITEGGD